MDLEELALYDYLDAIRRTYNEENEYQELRKKYEYLTPRDIFEYLRTDKNI